MNRILRYCNMATIAIILSLCFAAGAMAQGQSTGKRYRKKLVAPDRGSEDLFGTSASISGDYAIVGANEEDQDANDSNTVSNAGSAYIFKRDTASGDWNKVQKIVASDRQSFDFFGSAVGISGNYAIVGAYSEDHDTSGTSSSTTSTNGSAGIAGSAYIFERDALSGKWKEVQKIVASDRQLFDYFGYSVSISGNYVLVGAYGESHDASGTSASTTSSNGYEQRAGSAYLFERDALSGKWKEVQKIVASDRQLFDYFGYSVSISGNYVLVGAYRESHDTSGTSSSTTSTNGSAGIAGSAYLFERDAVSGKWKEVQKIVASDRESGDQFGWSVSLSGNYAIVGAFEEDHDASGSNTASSAGSAYIFERDTGSGKKYKK